MDVQAAIVVDEAQPSELIQKETHPGPGGADHLGERFLTDLRNDELRLPVLPKVGQQQEHLRQPLFARVSDLRQSRRLEKGGTAQSGEML